MTNLWALAVAGLVVLAAPQGRGEAITVSAAASLTDAMGAMAAAYTAEGGGTVHLNFAGSNALARQIVSGAPVDVFVSADGAQMDTAQRAGAIDESTRVNLLGNRLAVVALPGLVGKTVESLLSPGVRRIAVGDPAAVPAGVYARHYFERAGLWDRLQPKLVPVSNVRAALAAVENGSADAAVVFATDAALARRASLAMYLDGPNAPRILYPAAIVRATRHRAEAERFMAFLMGTRASAIFERFGFRPIGTTTTR